MSQPFCLCDDSLHATTVEEEEEDRHNRDQRHNGDLDQVEHPQGADKRSEESKRKGAHGGEYLHTDTELPEIVNNF